MLYEYYVAAEPPGGDQDVKNFYDGVFETAIENLCIEIKNKLGDCVNLRERVVMAIAIMENYCHMTMNVKHLKLDLEYIKKQTVKQVKELFEEE